MKYNVENVLAGIVTYNPDIKRLNENITALLKQVQYVYIVDNSSDNIKDIESLIIAKSAIIELKKYEKNLGIAQALKEIMEYSKHNRFTWVLSLDQDSVIEDGLIDKYIEACNLQECADVGMFTCLIRDRNFNDKKYEEQYQSLIEVPYCITSAAFMNVDKYFLTNGYDSKFFIDAVDFDICYSLRDIGYRICRINYTGLYHEIGHGENRHFLWKKIVVYHQKSFRIYYYSRNMLLMQRKHKKLYTFGNMVKNELALFIRILLYEDYKKEKIDAYFRGLRDAKKHNKINIILPGLGDSGGIKVIYIYKDLLEKNGWDIKIYCSVVANNLHRYSSSLKNTLHQIYCTGKAFAEINKKRNVRWVPIISDSTIRNADITIATMWATAYDVARLSPCKGEKYYFIQDFEVWDNKERGLNSYKLPLKKIVISTWINNQLRDNLGIGPFPVVMNGIDNSIFFDRHIRNDSSKVFLMLNHTLEKKGVNYGIQVFEKIREKYPDAQLKMFGTCDRSNIPDYIEYYRNPSREQLVNLYSMSNYFIFPSLEEGWGLTPLEAMACGCVVVGTNTGFVLNVGKHKENMMISEPGNIDEMVQNIKELITNKKLKKEIQKYSVEIVNELKWEKAADKLSALLVER